MALNEMLLKNDFNLDILPDNLNFYFENLYREINPDDLAIIWTLSVFRECLSLDDLSKITKKNLSELLVIFKKREIENIIRKNHCSELFNSLFSEYVCNNLEKLSPVQFAAIHSAAAEFYIEKLQEPKNISPDKLIFAQIEAPFHSCKAKSPKILEVIGYSSDFKIIWGYLDEAMDEFRIAYDFYQQSKDKSGMSSMLNNIGRVYQDLGKPEKALEYYEKALAIDEELKDIRGKATLWNNIGRVYQDWGKPEKAMEYFQKSLYLFKELSDERSSRVVEENIDKLHRQL